MAPKVVLINDTSLFAKHFGCQLVCQTFREQFARVGLELSLSLPNKFDESVYAAQLSAASLLVINGEGSIHHGNHLHLIRLASKYPTVLVNCVYQENPEMPELRNLLYIAARESLSANEIRNQGVNCEVVPDVIFASSMLRAFPKPVATREMGITDNVVEIKKGRLERIKNQLGIKSKDGESPSVRSNISKYLKWMCSHQRLCIGRFHGVVAASVLGIPFSSWDSNTWKTRGLMQDMGVAHLHYPSFMEAKENVPREFNPLIGEFSERAKTRVKMMFDHIYDIAAG